MAEKEPGLAFPKTCAACGKPWSIGHVDECQGPTRAGGRREGAGRKPRDPLGTLVVSLRLTGEEKAAFDMLGGVTWLREYLGSLIAGADT